MTPRALIGLAVVLNLGLWTYWRFVDTGDWVPPAVPEKMTPPAIVLASERPAPKPLCQSLGPLPSRQQMVAVENWLGDRFGTVSEREGSAPAPSSYRVEITTPSADLAARMVQKLKAAGVGDLAVLPPEPGETSVVIALGLYSDRANADRRQVAVRRMGVEPTINVIGRRQTLYWLDLTSTRFPDPAEALKVVPAAGKLQLLPCDEAIPSEEEAAPTGETQKDRAGASPSGPASPADRRRSSAA